MTKDWRIFRGDGTCEEGAEERLKSIGPPWRRLEGGDDVRARTYVPSGEEILAVNAALYLKRPLLVTGDPGTGKSSLAYAIAKDLGLEPVLKWPVNSRSALTEGLYAYDAVGRLREATRNSTADDSTEEAQPIEKYLELRWLGVALASPRPRVLLIDEIDKADADLPNDLLHVLEDGSFRIPELQRIGGVKEIPSCEVGATESFRIAAGVVRCQSFPIIVLTSNGERELPLAFHRRCVRLDLKAPSREQLKNIVNRHLADAISECPGFGAQLETLIDGFVTARVEKRKTLATDQLLNLVYLLSKSGLYEAGEAEEQSSAEERLKAEQRSNVQKLLLRGLAE